MDARSSDQDYLSQLEEELANRKRLESLQSALSNRKNESYIEKLNRAPGLIGQDIKSAVLHGIESIPQYLEAAKTEIPGAMGLMGEAIFNPSGEAGQKIGMQLGAGLAEKGKEIFNLPHNLANYASQRLELLPENINRHIQMARMPEDTEQLVNDFFGKPQDPGESLMRGIGRHSDLLPLLPNILKAGGKATGKASMLIKPQETAKQFTKENLQEINKSFKQINKFESSAWDKLKKGETGETNLISESPYGGFTTHPKDFFGLTETEMDALSPLAKKLWLEVEKKPNIKNTHNFYSQVGKDKFKTKDYNASQTLSSLHNRINEILRGKFKQLGLEEDFNAANEATKTKKGYELNKLIKAIGKGQIKPGDISNTQLKNAIIDSAKKGLPETHPLNKLKTDIVEKQEPIVESRKRYKHIAKHAATETSKALFFEEILRHYLGKLLGKGHE